MIIFNIAGITVCQSIKSTVIVNSIKTYNKFLLLWKYLKELDIWIVSLKNETHTTMTTHIPFNV